MKKQGDKCGLEEEIDVRAACDDELPRPIGVVIELPRGAEKKWTQRCDKTEVPAQPLAVRHQETRNWKCQDTEERQNSKGSTHLFPVAVDVGSVEPIQERESTFEIQKPRSDGNCLRLHSIEPFSSIEI